MRLRANFIWGITGALILLAISDASAQPYPSQRMTLVVPFPPGSATDSVTRHLAESIRGSTNITVVVENKPGADGNLAALSVLKAEPDGYTAFVTTNSTQAANASLFNSLPYDPKTDDQARPICTRGSWPQWQFGPADLILQGLNY